MQESAHESAERDLRFLRDRRRSRRCRRCLSRRALCVPSSIARRCSRVTCSSFLLSHVPTLPDLPTTRSRPFFALVQRVAAALPDALDADGSFVAINNVVSQSVPHLHVHVVPRRRKDGLRGFFWPREKYVGRLRSRRDRGSHPSAADDLRSGPDVPMALGANATTEMLEKWRANPVRYAVRNRSVT